MSDFCATSDECINRARSLLGFVADDPDHKMADQKIARAHAYATLALAITANNDSEYKRRRIDDVADAWLFGTGEPQELKGLSGLFGDDDEGEGPET